MLVGNDKLTIEYVGQKAVDSTSAGSGTISTIMLVTLKIFIMVEH